MTIDLSEIKDKTNLRGISFESIHLDLEIVDKNLSVELPKICGPLAEIISFIMSASGKRIRPALALLVGYLTSLDSESLKSTNSGKASLKPQHFILAELTELIHTASLVHDDLLDQSIQRRGQETIHLKWGTKVAVITGDFLFAQASVKLGEINNTEIVSIYAQVLAELCIGEINQAQSRFDLSKIDLNNYITKSTNKTASLFSAATKSAALLNQLPNHQVEQMFSYGQNLGIAFQIIDDLIDFTSESKELGKPAMGDLMQGIFTAPVIYALQDETVNLQLKELIKTRFADPGSLNEAKDLISSSGGFDKTLQLAESYVTKALTELESFPNSAYKENLQQIAQFVLKRHS
jgi:all-trans-nonaprenyl-diphosphate synthase